MSNYSSGTQTATPVIGPIAGRSRWYTVRHGGQLVGRIRSRFVDGARARLAGGFPPHTVIELRHAGIDAIAMRAVLGVAACLKVTDHRFGRSVRHRKAPPSDAAASLMRSGRLGVGHQPGPALAGAIGLARRHSQRLKAAA
jgi:hypothetical protein